MTPRERAQEIIATELELASKSVRLEWTRIIEKAVAAAVEEEREACAKICDGHANDHRSAPEDSPVQYAASEADTLASAIRNRKGIDQ